MTATTAKTAAQRATIALELLCRTTTGQLYRNFSDCFEMGDGDAVVRAGLKKLRRSTRYRAAVRRWAGVTAWRDYVTHWDNPFPGETIEQRDLRHSFFGK